MITMQIRLPSHFEIRASEWMLALITILWGCVLLSGAPFFDNEYFAVMHSMADQKTWGFVATLIGGLHLLALYWNGTKQKSPHLRAICSGLGGIFWLQVTLGYLATWIISPDWVIYPVFFTFSLYNVVRAMKDARLSDEKAKAGGRGASRSYHRAF